MKHRIPYSGKTGFTLVELMVVVAIIGILAMVAIPQYRAYLERTQRKSAQEALVLFANAMERYWSENHTYADAAVPDPSAPSTPSSTGEPLIFPNAAPLDSEPKVYDLAIISADADTFNLRATPKADGALAGDGYFEITNTGATKWVVGSTERPWPD